MTVALSGADNLLRRAGGAALRALRYGSGCLLVTGWEGEADDIARRRAPAARRLRAAGALPLGRGPGEAWRGARFAGPYLRDTLLDRGVLVETLETAATWTGLPALHRVVRDALSTRAGRHARRWSAATSPTSIPTAPRSTSPCSPRRTRTTPPGSGGRRSARRATRSSPPAPPSPITTPSGATTASGRRRSTARSAPRCCARLKAACDPEGIMNPGKLLP